MKSLSRVQLFATPWTVAYQAPQSMEFSRQEYWSGLPLKIDYDQFIWSILLWSLESLLWVSSHLFFSSCDSREICSFASFLLFASRWTKWKILTFQLCSRKAKNKSTAYIETFKNNFLRDDAMLWVLPVKTEVCYKCCHTDLFHPCGIFLVFLSFLSSHILRCFMTEKNDH